VKNSDSSHGRHREFIMLGSDFPESVKQEARKRAAFKSPTRLTVWHAAPQVTGERRRTSQQSGPRASSFESLLWTWVIRRCRFLHSIASLLRYETI
jgi:hypothetical protein